MRNHRVTECHLWGPCLVVQRPRSAVVLLTTKSAPILGETLLPRAYSESPRLCHALTATAITNDIEHPPVKHAYWDPVPVQVPVMP